MKIAVLGNGSIGKRHMRNLKNLGYNDIICMDPAPHVKKQVNELFPETVQHDTLEDVFLKGRPSIAFICSPPQHHLIQLEMALDHGCHVFVEKPFSLNTEGVESTLRKADRQGLKVMTGFNMRYVESILKMKQWVDTGRIGQVLTCRMSMSSFMPKWHPWEDYRECFMAFRESGGGAIFDYVHGIDMAQWLVGDIKQVFSMQRTTSLEMETDDVAMLIGVTEKGVLLNFYFDFIDHLNQRRIELIGTKGTVSWELSTQHTVSLYEAKSNERTVIQTKFDWDSCYIEEIKDFFRCIKENSPIVTDGWNGLSTQEVLGMAVESNKTGAMVTR